MSLRPRETKPVAAHLTMKDFTGLIKANEGQRIADAAKLTDAQMIAALEKNGWQVAKAKGVR